MLNSDLQLNHIDRNFCLKKDFLSMVLQQLEAAVSVVSSVAPSTPLRHDQAKNSLFSRECVCILRL